MGTGAITDYVDVAQLVLYLFWIFFAGLVYYLTIEGKREGFPLIIERPNGTTREDSGWAGMPAPKTYKTAFHGDFTAPHDRDRSAPAPKGKPIAPFPGLGLEPQGDPMTSDIGPGAYTLRSDSPDRTVDGAHKIVPLRIAAGDGFSLAHQDLDPRGLTVFGADKQSAGKVVEVWVDRSEHLIRYFEVETTGGRRVLLPMNFSRVHRDRIKGNRIAVEAILAGQFEGVPTIKSMDSITLLEEEKVTAYFGAGTLFATPRRRDPLA
ncbi:MAG: photosynthetic reaction center subunit H [Betaproteobacteria bacterium]|nr:photosynthetic reaction center subunit H [Betaproteobacteria bacterium]